MATVRSRPLRLPTPSFSLPKMNTHFQAGFHQTLDFTHPHQITITDKIYGRHTITEPILLQLLHAPALQRLAGVHQHGISGLLNLTPRVTRLEHSIGAALLVRLVGGSLAEQVAGLLHDISHTTMSHVVDFALTKPGEGSFHEVHKMRYVATTDVPQILHEFGFSDLKPLEEELFPLVERDAPRLCADRLDYALRDAVAFGYLSVEQAQGVVSSLRAFPSSEAADRVLVLRDERLALVLAQVYMACDRDVWGNAAHGELYTRTAELMRSVIHSGAIAEEELWTLSDQEFWEKMRRVLGPEERKALEALETDGLSSEDGLAIPRKAKVRTIDPDVWELDSTSIRPLSHIMPVYALEREEYIRARHAMYAPA